VGDRAERVDHRGDRFAVAHELLDRIEEGPAGRDHLAGRGLQVLDAVVEPVGIGSARIYVRIRIWICVRTGLGHR
jgi:hypothetical protein